jgi:hypothetical protein
MRLAKVIRVERLAPRSVQLFLDGEEFPFYLADERIEVRIDQDNVGTVRLTLMAERVEVLDDLTPTRIVDKASEGA